MAVAGLPGKQRHRALLFGIGGATFLRILMACFAVQLLHVTGLLAAGGILLLWVCWKMACELHLGFKHKAVKETPAQKFSSAIWQIIIADVSMSLDNVLGVAGVARDHIVELVLGLSLSVILMGAASSQIARLTIRYPKIIYVGIAIVFYTAVNMIWDGSQQLLHSTHAFAWIS
jgi:YjbE family integral membrane protein